MRLAKSFVTVVALLALLGWGAKDASAQSQTPTKAPTKAQPAGQGKTPPATPAPSKAAAPKQVPTPAKPAKKAEAVAKQPSKPSAKAQPKGAAKAPAKVRPVAAVQPATPVARRDPFDPLIGRAQAGAVPERLPPAKAGLVIGTLRVDGLVRAPNGMIGVVSNPQQRVYFLREGDQLYDGRVEQITMDAITFHEVGKDAFGKPVERQVTKRLYPSPGEPR
jgi:Tfp pilus assembly protein PilP